MEHRAARKSKRQPSKQKTSEREEAPKMADGDPIRIGQANTASNPGNETSLSRNEDTAGTVFVARNLNLGDGIHGEAGTHGTGFHRGVLGSSSGIEGIGVQGGNSNDGIGVMGVSYR